MCRGVRRAPQFSEMNSAGARQPPAPGQMPPPGGMFVECSTTGHAGFIELGLAL